jgi:chemotaxis protein histidine kinase CheA
MTAMCKHWFANPDGSLKTFRISLVVFLAVLVGLGVIREGTRSKDTLLVQVSHVFEPEAVQKESEAEQQVPTPEFREKVEKPVPEKSEPREKVEKQEAVEEQEAEEKQALAEEMETQAPEKTESPMAAVAEKTDDMAQQTGPSAALVKPASLESPAETVPEKTRQAEQVPLQSLPEKMERISLAQDMENWLRKNRSDSGQDPESPAREREPADLRVSLSGAVVPDPSGNAIELTPEEYAALYEQWRRSGDHLESDRQGIALRIMDLETVYDLFQMKVVAFRGQTPYMDLADNTRVAPQSLDGYSGTCFVVSRPWEKWGDALSRAGFRKNDAVEVRYYTYQFVRNAIFARAARAVEWSSAAGPGAEADLSSADVLGRVYGVSRSGGGAFGVFVPVRVDFASGPSVAVDPLACFPNEPDILALNQAGLL